MRSKTQSVFVNKRKKGNGRKQSSGKGRDTFSFLHGEHNLSRLLSVKKERSCRQEILNQARHAYTHKHKMNVDRNEEAKNGL